MPKTLRRFHPLIFIVCLGMLLKLALLAANVVPFNSDEAVVGLMARHILAGERPVFFYGQAYMGSLDAYLTAAVYALFGPAVWGIRVVQVLLYGAVIGLVYHIALDLFHSTRAAIWAALFTALPPVNTVLYTTASLGGYNEALLIGCLSLWLGLKLIDRLERRALAGLPGLALAWGLLLGLGLWANALTLVFAAPVGLGIAYCWLKNWPDGKNSLRLGLPLILLAGFLLGSLPWWMFALQNGLSNLTGELLGGAVAVEKDPWLVRTGNHLVNFFLLGGTALFGFRPPWAVRWLATPLIPLAAVFWGWVWVRVVQLSRSDPAERRAFGLTLGTAGILLLAFVFTSFGVDPSGRYFLPVYLVLSLAAGRVLSLVQRPLAAGAAGGLVLVFHLWGVVSCAATNPPGLTTQFYEPARVDHRQMMELVDFLQQENETTGYTNYWVAYPLAFLSDETLIFIPRLPYHPDFRYTARDDRYPPYQALVAHSDRVAYITTRHPELNERLREGFRAKGITWQEKGIGEYQVFYRLSQKIEPAALELGLVK